jgi:hypothetical protein
VLAIERDGITVYYMANSSNEKFNVTNSADGVMTYRQVFAQGIKGQHIQYFGNAAFEAFQRNGNLEGVKPTQMGEAEATAPIESAEESTDGTPLNVPEGNYIEIGQDVTDMFTDAEWNQMFQEFKNDHKEMFNREEWADFNVNDFKELMMDTSDSQNVNILNDLAKRIGRGEKMKTIDENGKEIDVC